MSEEEVKRYMAGFSDRAKELVEDPKKAQAVLEASGICDHNGNLTEKYR